MLIGRGRERDDVEKNFENLNIKIYEYKNILNDICIQMNDVKIIF